MHILVVAQRRQESESHRTVLCGLGHTVTTASSTVDIQRTLFSGPRPEVALLVDPGPDWMDAIRAAEGPHIYAIGALERMGSKQVKEAYDLGLDDIMSTKATSDELAGRVDAVQRIRQWVGSMGDAFAIVDDDISQRFDCLRNLGHILAAEFGDMTGASLSSENLGEDRAMHCAAEIPLTLLSDSTELMLGVGVRAHAVESFSNMVFGGTVAHDILADATREFANTAGGSVKRHASDEGATLSIGLPEDNVAPDVPAGKNSWRLHGDGMEICAWLIVRDDTPKRISASMLRQGMVISKPVKNAAGVLLVPAGSVLTARTVSRLLDMLGPSTLVEVARAA